MASIAKNEKLVPSSHNEIDEMLKGFMNERGWNVSMSEVSEVENLNIKVDPLPPKKDYSTLKIGVMRNMVRYLISKTDAIEDARVFICDPHYQILAGMANMAESKMVKRLRNVFLLKKIPVNHKVFLPPNYMDKIFKRSSKFSPIMIDVDKIDYEWDDLIPEDLSTPNDKYIRIRLISIENMPLFKKKLNKLNKKSRNIGINVGVSKHYSSQNGFYDENLKGGESCRKLNGNGFDNNNNCGNKYLDDNDENNKNIYMEEHDNMNMEEHDDRNMEEHDNINNNEEEEDQDLSLEMNNLDMEEFNENIETPHNKMKKGATVGK